MFIMPHNEPVVKRRRPVSHDKRRKSTVNDRDAVIKMYDHLSPCVTLPPSSTTCIDSDNRLKREAKGRIIYLSGILHESDEGAREKAADFRCASLQ